MVTNRAFFALSFAIITARAVFGFQLRRAVQTGRDFDRYLTVRGLSEREAKADLVVWPIRFAATADDLPALKNAIEALRTQIVAYLTSAGIKPEQIHTGLPSIDDREERRLSNEKLQSIARYEAQTTLVVRSPEVDVVKRAIQNADQLLNQGVLLSGESWDSKPSFTFNGVNELKPDMIKEATANARAAAEKFAQDSNSKVGAIRKASQGVLESYDRDPASPERKTIRVVTTVEFFLE